MKRNTVIIAPYSLEQINAQAIHIAENSVSNALAWEARVHRAIDDLGDMAGYAIDEDASDRLGYTVRKLVFERTYLIHFTIDKAAGVVRVVGFRHGARLPGKDEP